MEIRRATGKDLDIIANIESNSGYRWGMGKEEAKEMIKESINNKKSEFYILYTNIKPVGYIVLSFNKKNKICYSDFTAVIKSKQGKGYSSLLKEKSILIARKNNCKYIESTVWAKNFKMIGLNNKFGFYVYDIKRNFYPNEDSKIVMRKELK